MLKIYLFRILIKTINLTLYFEFYNMKIENYNYEKSDVSFLIGELYILLIKF